ncbi:hypothetical protein DIPPA_12753 [Diplonema papillatum]|nr:hypothetical protein DIPPA_12753 [Diplonema papillatum]
MQNMHWSPLSLKKAGDGELGSEGDAPIRCFDVSADYLITGAADGVVRVFDRALLAEVGSFSHVDSVPSSIPTGGAEVLYVKVSLDQSRVCAVFTSAVGPVVTTTSLAAGASFLRPIHHHTKHDTDITSVAWAPDRVFSADNSGAVIGMSNSHGDATLTVREECSIVQISVRAKMLSVSTLRRAVTLAFAESSTVVPVGQQQREGAYGACLAHGFMYSSRPRKDFDARVWKADPETGAVKKTLMFRHLEDVNCPAVVLSGSTFDLNGRFERVGAHDGHGKYKRADGAILYSTSGLWAATDASKKKVLLKTEEHHGKDVVLMTTWQELQPNESYAASPKVRVHDALYYESLRLGDPDRVSVSPLQHKTSPVPYLSELEGGAEPLLVAWGEDAVQVLNPLSVKVVSIKYVRGLLSLCPGTVDGVPVMYVLAKGDQAPAAGLGLVWLSDRGEPNKPAPEFAPKSGRSPAARDAAQRGGADAGAADERADAEPRGNGLAAFPSGSSAFSASREAPAAAEDRPAPDEPVDTSADAAGRSQKRTPTQISPQQQLQQETTVTTPALSDTTNSFAPEHMNGFERSTTPAVSPPPSNSMEPSEDKLIAGSAQGVETVILSGTQPGSRQSDGDASKERAGGKRVKKVLRKKKKQAKDATDKQNDTLVHRDPAAGPADDQDQLEETQSNTLSVTALASLPGAKPQDSDPLKGSTRTASNESVDTPMQQSPDQTELPAAADEQKPAAEAAESTEQQVLPGDDPLAATVAGSPESSPQQQQQQQQQQQVHRAGAGFLRTSLTMMASGAQNLAHNITSTVVGSIRANGAPADAANGKAAEDRDLESGPIDEDINGLKVFAPPMVSEAQMKSLLANTDKAHVALRDYELQQAYETGQLSHRKLQVFCAVGDWADELVALLDTDLLLHGHGSYRDRGTLMTPTDRVSLRKKIAILLTAYIGFRGTPSLVYRAKEARPQSASLCLSDETVVVRMLHFMKKRRLLAEVPQNDLVCNCAALGTSTSNYIAIAYLLQCVVPPPRLPLPRGYLPHPASSQYTALVFDLWRPVEDDEVADLKTQGGVNGAILRRDLDVVQQLERVSAAPLASIIYYLPYLFAAGSDQALKAQKLAVKYYPKISWKIVRSAISRGVQEETHRVLGLPWNKEENWIEYQELYLDYCRFLAEEFPEICKVEAFVVQYLNVLVHTITTLPVYQKAHQSVEGASADVLASPREFREGRDLQLNKLRRLERVLKKIMTDTRTYSYNPEEVRSIFIRQKYFSGLLILGKQTPQLMGNCYMQLLQFGQVDTLLTYFKEEVKNDEREWVTLIKTGHRLSNEEKKAVSGEEHVVGPLERVSYLMTVCLGPQRTMQLLQRHLGDDVLYEDFYKKLEILCGVSPSVPSRSAR